MTSMSTSSLAVAGAGTVSSMRNTSVGSSIGSMGPPVGKPLSPADVRNVFLNLDQLAGAAEEMANAMEAAMGDITPPTVGRDGETGNDRLGEVFVNLVSVASECVAQLGARVVSLYVETDADYIRCLNSGQSMAFTVLDNCLLPLVCKNFLPTPPTPHSSTTVGLT